MVQKENVSIKNYQHCLTAFKLINTGVEWMIFQHKYPVSDQVHLIHQAINKGINVLEKRIIKPPSENRLYQNDQTDLLDLFEESLNTCSETIGSDMKWLELCLNILKIAVYTHLSIKKLTPKAVQKMNDEKETLLAQLKKRVDVQNTVLSYHKKTHLIQLITKNTVLEWVLSLICLDTKFELLSSQSEKKIKKNKDLTPVSLTLYDAQIWTQDINVSNANKPNKSSVEVVLDYDHINQIIDDKVDRLSLSSSTKDIIRGLNECYIYHQQALVSQIKDTIKNCESDIKQAQGHARLEIIEKIYPEKQQMIFDIYQDQGQRIQEIVKWCKKILSHNDRVHYPTLIYLKQMIAMIQDIVRSLLEWVNSQLTTYPLEALIEGKVLQDIKLYLQPKNKDMLRIVHQMIGMESESLNKEFLDEMTSVLDMLDSMQTDKKSHLKKQIVTLSNDSLSNKDDLSILNNLLLETMDSTHSESGTIFIKKNNELHFLLAFNHILEMNQMSPEKLAKTFPPIQCINPKTGEKNISYLCVYSVLNNKLMNIKSLEAFKLAIAYKGDEADLVGSEVYEKYTGYQSKTLLCCPIVNHKNNVIGAIQIANHINSNTGQVDAYSEEHEDFIQTIAKLALKPLEKYQKTYPFMKHLYQLWPIKKGWFKKSYPVYKQMDEMDCGPTCLRMIAAYYGKEYALQYLREKCHLTTKGVSLLSLINASESLGFRAIAYKVSLESLTTDVKLPCILHWGNSHFIVVYKVTARNILIADPSYGLLTYNHDRFFNEWKKNNSEEDIAILSLSTTPYFFKPLNKQQRYFNLTFFFNYFKPYKGLLIQLCFVVLLVTCFTVVPAILIQLLIDRGVEAKDLEIVYLIFIAYLMLLAGNMLVTLVCQRIIGFMSHKINTELFKDFFQRFFYLKGDYFESKTRSDFLQRYNDHIKVEAFLQHMTLKGVLNSILVILFLTVLFYYNGTLSLIYITGTALCVLWYIFVLKKRKLTDYKASEQSAFIQSLVTESIHNIQDIKLNGIEKRVRKKLEKNQIDHLRLKSKKENYDQLQYLIYNAIDQIKNILITFLSATYVIETTLSIGMLVAIQYIIGQTNRLIQQLLYLIPLSHDVKFAIERLKDIYQQPSAKEEKPYKLFPKTTSIKLKNVSYSYEGPDTSFAIKNIHMTIPEKKMTAIVGASGSGKSTLLKLLLKYYKPTKGVIEYDYMNINQIPTEILRQHMTCIMQESYLFDESIYYNITLSHERVNKQKFNMAVENTCLDEFINQFPAKYHTHIGKNGLSLSVGQRQQIFLSRMIYKQANMIFLDEPTESLDSILEHKILRNLKQIYQNKTMVLATHRISRVKEFDHIIVLNKGEIQEQGTHESLMKLKSLYYCLVNDERASI